METHDLRIRPGEQASRHPCQAVAGIPLDAERARELGDGVEAELRTFFRNTRFELFDDRSRLRLKGPDLYYHRLDPDLPAHLGRLGIGDGLAGAGLYRVETGTCGICLEDCWSGAFIADTLRRTGPDDALVLVHLDDHADMMPTFLARRGGGLVDPSTGRTFDPCDAGDWQSPILSGAIGIGSFVTPLLHAGRTVHIRHLNNSRDDDAPARIGPGGVSHALMPDTDFAAVAWDVPARRSTGTYFASTDPDTVLSNLPDGRLVVHVDFDYFINDFNGNPGQSPLPRDTARAPEIVAKATAFFSALEAAGRTVERWVIATSPGFCASRHWDGLFDQMKPGVGLTRSRASGLRPEYSP